MSKLSRIVDPLGVSARVDAIVIGAGVIGAAVTLELARTARTDRGIDHDLEPVQVVGARTGRSIDLGAFSRLREPAATSGSVMG